MGSSFAGNVQSPQVPTFNTGATYGAATGDISGLSGTYGGLGASVLPQAQATTSNLVNNPFAPQAISGAQTGANYGTAAAGTNFNTGTSLVPYAQQILQTGMDPQNALFTQEQQQVRDQSNVNNAQAGVATTPYGAGATTQATTNFDIAWLNNELSRQTQAAGAASSLDTAASNLYTPAGQQEVQSATIPYATYSDIGTGQDTALSELLGIGGSGANLSNMSITDLISLLQGGNAGNSVANSVYGNQLQQANLGFNQIGTLASAGAGIAGDLAFL
jgi:hypothetical protein